MKSSNGATRNGRKLTVLYNCAKCPAYCCTYDRIEITERDLARLARHFGLSPTEAERRYTKTTRGNRVFRHKMDKVFYQVCQFLDIKERRCTIYEARPQVCREYPDSLRCGYYDFLCAERRRQDDEKFVPSP